MASRDRNAEHFEQWIVNTIEDQGLIESQDNHDITVSCPCCKTGLVRLEINGRFKQVMAKCSNHEDGKCGSHKVIMPYNNRRKSAIAT
jgi:hypothetical protein